MFSSIHQMGRPSTGAWVTFEAARIDLSYLLKQGYIRKNCKTVGSLYWNINGEPTGSISIESMYGLGECWVRLLYHVTDSKGLKTDYDYKIYIERVPSNLGKGEVLYFLCPLTGQRCRILYRAYGSRKWFCREAYRKLGNRLYYECQQNSKLNHYNNRWWQLD